MSTTMPPPSTKTTAALSDERREWIRIDDRVLLEYRLLSSAYAMIRKDKTADQG